MAALPIDKNLTARRLAAVAPLNQDLRIIAWTTVGNHQWIAEVLVSAPEDNDKLRRMVNRRRTEWLAKGYTATVEVAHHS